MGVVLGTDSSIFLYEEGYNIRTSYESPIPNYQLVKKVGKVKDFATGDIKKIKGHVICQVQQYRLKDALISCDHREDCKEIQSKLDHHKKACALLTKYGRRENNYCRNT